MIPLLLLIAVGGMMQAARSFTTDTSLAGPELTFGYLLLASYFTSKILSRFGFPKLTAYIIAGVISGPFVLGFVTKDMGHSLDIVKDTATAILALEAGAMLELKKVRPVMGTLRGITIYGVIGSMFTIGGVLFLMRPMLPFFDRFDLTQSVAICMVIGVALSAQSPAVVMAMLAETRAEGPVSQMMLASVVVADLTVITVFSVALAITGAVIGGGIDVTGTTLDVAWELFGSMVFGVLIGMVIGAFLRSVERGASLFALMICMIVAEIGVKMNLDPLIVLLAAGIWLRNFSKADATQLLDNFEGAQLPVFLVFFALAGTKLDLQTLWSSLFVVGIIALVRAGTFFAGARLACRRNGAEDLVTKYAWFGLVPQAGLALALALVLQKTFRDQFGAPEAGNGAATILFGVVGFNEAIAPIILRVMLLRSGEAGKKKGIDFAAGGH